MDRGRFLAFDIELDFLIQNSLMTSRIAELRCLKTRHFLRHAVPLRGDFWVSRARSRSNNKPTIFGTSLVHIVSVSDMASELTLRVGWSMNGRLRYVSVG